MCKMCDDNDDEYVGCPECGRLICWDIDWEAGDDVIQRATATPGGDLVCRLCAIRIEAEEEKMYEDEMEYFPGPWDDWAIFEMEE